MIEPARPRGEAGFTLVELLVVVAILGIVAAAITESIIIGLRTTTRTENQLLGSIDRQRLTTAFVPDVQSAQAVDGTVCGPAGGTEVVTLSWSDRGTNKSASYVLETTTEGPKLFRRYCEDGELATEKVVADHLGGAPEVDCTAAPACIFKALDDQGQSYRVSASRRSDP